MTLERAALPPIGRDTKRMTTQSTDGGEHIEGLAEVGWEVEPSRSGLPTLKIGGRYAESRYRPLESAAQTARSIIEDCQSTQADFVILIGAGLGYLIEALRCQGSPPLLVWEPFPALREAIDTMGVKLPSVGAPQGHRKRRTKGQRGQSEARVWKWPGGKSLRIVSGPADFDRALVEFTAHSGRPHLVIHPGYEVTSRFEARYAARAVRQRLGRRGPLELSQAVVSERSLRALRNLPFCGTVADLSEMLEGQTAIIASAGPSIRAASPLIAAREGGALLACVQALKPLAAAGAHIDFATCADPSDIFAACKVDPQLPFDALLADTSCEPQMIERRIDRSFLFHLRTPHVHQLAWEACGLPVIDEPCLTISEISLLLAHSFGARRFILAGVDFDSNEERYPERFTARNLKGEAVSTNSHYFHGARYLSDLCARLAREGAEFYRFGEGLPIDGAEVVDERGLRALLADLPRFTTPSVGRHASPERMEVVTALLEGLRRHDPAEVKPNPGSNDLLQFGSGFAAMAPGAWPEAALNTLGDLGRCAAEGDADPSRSSCEQRWATSSR